MVLRFISTSVTVTEMSDPVDFSFRNCAKIFSLPLIKQEVPDSNDYELLNVDLYLRLLKAFTSG